MPLKKKFETYSSLYTICYHREYFLITLSVILKIRNVMLCLCFLTKKIIHYIACRFVKTIKFTCKWNHKTHTYAICIWSCGDTEVILGNFHLEYCLTRPNSWSIHPISYLWEMAATISIWRVHERHQSWIEYWKSLTY